MLQTIGRLSLVAVAALIGSGIGLTGSLARYSRLDEDHYPFLTERHELPHHVPEHPGGVAFRFAMAHDVLLERFPKHGPDYYRERDRLTRLELARLKPGDPAWFEASDDLAVGVERLGRSDEAVEVIRGKLARQREQGLEGRDLYTSFANLGTFLIHGSFKASLAGDADARTRFREGVGLIRQSVEVNPQAHFGRERWQAAIAEFLLAAMDDPTLLTRFDCLGNRLDRGIEELMSAEGDRSFTGYGRAYVEEFGGSAPADVPAFFLDGEPLDDPSRWPDLKRIRKYITEVGAEEGWEKVPVPSHRKPVPFDEPVLGIIGMWRQGGGANPHFALAIGETMLRVGQRYIAWEAFERASKLADRFWPRQPEQQALREHCRKRQAGIEETLKRSANRSKPPRIFETPKNLRDEFQGELAFGEEYQRSYQEFESSRIEGGFSIQDEHFFDVFEGSRGSIASSGGLEEWYVGVPGSKILSYNIRRAKAWAMFGAGVAAMAMALLIRWRARRKAAIGPIRYLA